MSEEVPSNSEGQAAAVRAAMDAVSGRDMQKACALAEAGESDPECAYLLGLFKYTGKGTAEDRRSAAELFSEAAAKGYGPAAIVSSEISANPEEAESQIMDLRLRAECRDTVACRKIFGLYDTGKNPDGTKAIVKKDHAEAVRLYMPCADAGDTEAQNIIGYMYLMGKGVQKDRDLALKLLKEQGVFRTVEAVDATFGDEDLGEFLAQAGEGNSELVRWRKALAEQLNIRPMAQYDDRPIFKVVFMCSRMEQLEPARAALEKDYNFVVQDVAAHNCLNGEIVNRAFDKGRGVRIVADAFGFDIADTVGFGDSMNDLEMIQTVATSVCMDNGSPALKEISTLVCPAVEDDGLAWAFEKLGLC